MARFLFATFEGGGHVQPMLLVARGLIEQGHEALAVSDAVNASDAARIGVPFQAWRRAPSRADRSPASDPMKDWLASSPQQVVQALCDGVMCGPAAAYATDAAEAIDAYRPNVVVSQELLLGVMAGAESKGAKLALLAANVWPLPTLERATPFGIGAPPPATADDAAFYGRVIAATRALFQTGLPVLNAARAELGLPALSDLFGQLDAAGRVLLATSRAFDFEPCLPASFRYVGPYMADPAWTDEWRTPWGERPDKPVVLVSFSTMYQGQERALANVIEALGGLDVQGLVTLGPTLKAGDFSAPPNVAVMQSAPHSRIYPFASAVVTHAGHASTLRPLMAGAPLVMMPIGRDQPDNAVRVTERGAGLRLGADAPPVEIAAAIRQVLEDPSFRTRAQGLGARISADAEARSAEDVLVSFAKEAT